jgi:hypothetical protein
MCTCVLFRTVSQSVRLGVKPLETQGNYFLFQLNTCCFNPYVTTSLTRGWICRLQLLMALASAFIRESESQGAHDHIFLYHTRDSPNLEGQFPVFISPGTGWPGYSPRHWVPFLSPPTTRSATVQIFASVSTRGG